MTTKDSDWEKLNRIFAGAVELSPARQGEYLAEACGGDLGLLREAEAIIAAANRAEDQDFLESDAFAAGAKIIASGSAAEYRADTTIGNYKIIKEIGRGGMGTIFLAEREDFNHRVALKIIKRGMDTDDIVRRFRQEREVLAALNHPNIARLLDGGTTDDGLPFLVMEYVEGEPLSNYCQENSLNINDRLNLFRKICSAAAYAHQNLIVHRDLKPSNVLVDRDGEPKLLDFGIAKLLAPESRGQTTETGFGMLTPDYASPEQIRGERVATTSDVYSLGILLYEMLTGKKPYQITSRNAAEIIRAVCETEPQRPSSVVDDNEPRFEIGGTSRNRSVTRNGVKLTRALRGDLDNIILKALRKDPHERYSSVEQFSEDIDRYLSGLPVTARPATFRYKAAKYVERNRVTVAFAAAALVAILAGSSVAVWQGVVAAQERNRAENRLAEIRRLTGSLVSGWDKDIPENQITSMVRGRIADISSSYLEGLADETNDPAILKELAESYLELGHEYAWGQVNTEKAKASFQAAESIARGLIANDSSDLEAKDLLVRALYKYDEYFGRSDWQASLRNHLERLQLREENYAARPGDEKALESLADAVHFCGWVLNTMGRRDEAAPYFLRSAELTRQRIDLIEPAAKTAEERIKVSQLYSTITREQTNLRQFEQSVPNFVKAAQIADEALHAEPENLNIVHRRASTQYDLGLILKRTGDLDGAKKAFQKALEAYRKLSLIKVDGFLVVRESNILFDLAEVYHEIGDDQAAEVSIREAFTGWNQYDGLEINKGNTKNIARTAALNFAFGKLLMRIGKTADARATFRRSEELYSSLVDDGQMQIEDRRLADFYLTMGDVYSGIGVCRMADSGFQPFADQIDYCRFETGTVVSKNHADAARAGNYYQKAVTILSQLEADGQLIQNDGDNLRIARERSGTLAK